MTTHTTFRYTNNLGINMIIDMAKKLEWRNNYMQLSTGAYCKIIL